METGLKNPPRLCRSRRYSDQMQCGPCGLTWDVNDPDPPKCPFTERPAPAAEPERDFNYWDGEADRRRHQPVAEVSSDPPLPLPPPVGPAEAVVRAAIDSALKTADERKKEDVDV